MTEISTGISEVSPISPPTRLQVLPIWRLQLAGAVVLTLLGLGCFEVQLRVYWDLWTQDALRSIGICIPPLSLWLALRAWRHSEWTPTQGNWWGMALCLPAMTLGLLTGLMPQLVGITLSSDDGAAVFYPLNLLSTGVLLFAYFSGVVLLFGGVRAWRLAWFALALWLFVNPVPRAFQTLVDLPSQALGARMARGFASLIGVPVDGSALKLMFSPELGIFIAPGCDGLRGAATMGYLALIIGYLRGLTWRRWALFAFAAVMLAYLLNLLRLCAVIGYYWFALRIPVLGRYGTEIDYAIGGTLFAVAAWFLFRTSTPRRASA